MIQQLSESQAEAAWLGPHNDKTKREETPNVTQKKGPRFSFVW